MDLEGVRIGEWPNVAMEPGTLKHAATGERVERPDSAERLAADILAKSHSVALTSDGDFEQVESYVNVPVSTVRGWLDRQAALTGRCQPMQDLVDECDEFERIVDRLTAERDEWKAKAEAKSADCASNDDYPPESDVSATDVDANDANAAQGIREKLEERIAELESGHELNTLRLSVAGLKRTVDEQRDTIRAQRAELARFNERLHGKRQLPKHAKWPRFEDGKLVKVGRDCALVEMREKTYTLHGSDAEAWSAAYGDAAPDSWRKSEWRC